MDSVLPVVSLGCSHVEQRGVLSLQNFEFDVCMFDRSIYVVLHTKQFIIQRVFIGCKLRVTLDGRVAADEGRPGIFAQS